MQNYPIYKPKSDKSVEQFLRTRPWCMLITQDAAGVPQIGFFNPLKEGHIIYLHLHLQDPQLAAMKVDPHATMVFFDYHGFVPSYAKSEWDASFATMFYKSVTATCKAAMVAMQPEGARILQRMMEAYQPEGGYKPLTDQENGYQSSLDKIQVIALSIDRLDAKWKLGQNRDHGERLAAWENLR